MPEKEEEYDDVAQEIRHSILRPSFHGTEQDLLDALLNSCEDCIHQFVEPLKSARVGEPALVFRSQQFEGSAPACV